MQKEKESLKDGLGQELGVQHALKKKKRKWRWLLLAVAIVLGAGVTYAVFSGGQVSYEFVKAAKKDLQETVEITGNVEADATIALSFQASGRLAKLSYDTGDKVKKGEVIAELDNKEQKLTMERSVAQLAAAEAELAARLAGSTNEQIKIAEVQVEQAEVNYRKIERDLENAKEELELIKKKYLEDEKKSALMVKDAEDKLEFAKKNQTNTGNTDTQSVANAQKDLANQLLSTAATMQSALLNLKSVIVNDGLSALGQDFNRLDYVRVNEAQRIYFEVKDDFEELQAELKAGSNFTVAELKQFTADLTLQMNSLLTAQKLTSDALSILPPSSTLTEQEIANLKAQILGDSAAISSAITLLNGQLQKLINAELGILTSGDAKNAEVTAAQNLYDQQVQSAAQLKIDHQVDLNARQTQIEGYQSQLEIQSAAIASAKANLAQVKAGPRAVDVQALRAQIAAAKIDVQLRNEDYEKTLLRAPTDGILSRRNADVGEQISGAFSASASSSIPVFEMISASKYKIKADIAEVDIGKIQVGDKAAIVLDAVNDTKFEGTIVRIDPVSTEVQDVVFYKAEIVIDSEDARIMPGMTANVEIVLNEVKDAITVPERAVQRDGTERFVRVLDQDKKVQKLPVTTGIRSLSGDLEVKTGLTDGQEIILRIVTN